MVAPNGIKNAKAPVLFAIPPIAAISATPDITLVLDFGPALKPDSVPLFKNHPLQQTR